MLKPHIVFLESKGYSVTPINNVNEALELIEENSFALVLLDESMPGISGLEAIPMIKNLDSSIKIVMVTKNEEEHIMEQAIGSQIADYILKPVNPNQVLLSLKKNLEWGVLLCIGPAAPRRSGCRRPRAYPDGRGPPNGHDRPTTTSADRLSSSPVAALPHLRTAQIGRAHV